jgi:GDP-4-dehydro-6-deoxy-D-mannose reductase
VSGDPLITGATGFAGGHLLDRLRQRGRVWAWANPRGKPPSASSGDVRWQSVDLLDRGSIVAALRDARPSVIYHCGGIADVVESWRNPARPLHVNALGTHNLFEATRSLDLDCAVLVTGSALVYGRSTDVIDEEHPIRPATIYGVSKLAQELIAGQATNPVFLTRPFNHAGPRQATGYVTSAFAQQLAAIEAGKADAVLRVGNLDSRRDITDVRDTVRAYELIVERGTPRRPYNVCSGQAHRVGDLLDILLRLTRVRVRIEVDPERLRPSDNPLVLGTHERLTRDTGWRPEIAIERTLADLLDFWRASYDIPASAAAGPRS